MYMESQMQLAEIFKYLGNTASVAYCRYIWKSYDLTTYSGVEELKGFQKRNKFNEVSTMRHPDFKNAQDRKSVV